jgi:predicted  nucleic acid-binding Zn-ribbon protein
MAKETKKDPQDYTVEEKLKSLYQLQLIFSEIDRIKTLRGELPLEVQDLEDEVAGLRTRIANFTADIENIKSEEGKRKAKIEEAKAMIAKYTDVLKGVNIAEMINKSKGDYAYTIINTDHAVTSEVVETLEALDEVISVRVIK